MRRNTLPMTATKSRCLLTHSIDPYAGRAFWLDNYTQSYVKLVAEEYADVVAGKLTMKKYLGPLVVKQINITEYKFGSQSEKYCRCHSDVFSSDMCFPEHISLGICVSPGGGNT